MEAGRIHWIGLLLAGLALSSARGEEVVPLAVEAGQCSFVLPTGRGDDKYFLVVGALARTTGPFPVRIETQATSDPPALPRETVAGDPEWSRRVNEWRLYLERTRPVVAAATGIPAVAPPAERTFRLATEDVAIVGRLRGLGRHAQVYVDREESGPVAGTVAEIVRAFDEETYPAALQLLGNAADVDGDGRFTILLTPRLPAGLGGYVSRQDLDPRGSGNRSDLMVLSSALRPGPHLRALLAHEYTHAVAYSGGRAWAEAPRAEEDWLNEGLAHVAEEAQGHGWTNLDYRIAAYRQHPESYPLVVPDHYEAGLYRSAGHRGAAYLFLRHCTQRHGLELLRRLVQTPLVGVANLEVAAGEPFAELFRAWAVAQLSPPVASLHREDRPRLAQLFAGQETLSSALAGVPRFHELPLGGGRLDLELAGTAVGYALLHSPVAGGSRVTLASDPAAQLQVTLFKLPARTPRLTLRASKENGGVRLEVEAEDGDVTLESVLWAPQAPTGRSDLHEERARSWFAATPLTAGEARRSTLIAESEGDRPIVFRVVGTDHRGQVVTGWCVRDQAMTGRVSPAKWSPR